MIGTLLPAFALSVMLAAGVGAQSAAPSPNAGPNDGVVDATAPDAVVVYGGPEPLGIEIASGEIVRFDVEIADDPVNRERGMMFRESLADGAGMLFDFGEVRPVSIWMRNTLIPLDILYIRADGRIAKIIANAQPMSERQLWSDYPVLSVLEINGGAASAAGVAPGDQVLHPLFETRLPEPDAAQNAAEPESPASDGADPVGEGDAAPGDEEG